MGTNLKVCPHCNARALAPFLGPKRRCKACGAYVDVLDLLTGAFPDTPPAGARLVADPPR
ncbi:MAG: hypothetical protein LC624_09310 [Halobacteriales archaeon]|nr:hypothetical protein [Halobacteriales archaeon]